MAPLNIQQIVSLLQKQGIPKEKQALMAAIARAESSGDPQAFNPNAQTGDKSYGLFQVNMIGGLGPARMKQFGLKSEQELFNPETNVKAAKKILESQGLGAWSAYKSGAYQKFLPEAQKAVASGIQSQVKQQPKELAAAPTGQTFVIYGDQEEEKSPGAQFLEGFMKNAPSLQPAIDPSTFIAQAPQLPAGAAYAAPRIKDWS